MRRISPDVEQLMWLVAEEAQPDAIADFERRFPDLAPALAERVGIVRRIRRAKGARQGEIPPFRPSAAAPRPLRRGVYVGAGLVFAALAFASYNVTRALLSGPPLKGTNVPVHTAEPNPPVLEDRTASSSSTGTGAHSAPPSLEEAPERLKPMQAKMSGVPLAVALQAIAEKAGMTLVLAPGLPESEVSIAYQDMIAADILADMGEAYGFTPLDQGDGTVLIVPVRPKDEQPRQPADAAGPATRATGSSQ